MKYNYKLEILTPTHIGDGTSYSNKEYYISNAKLNKTEPVKLINKVNLTEYIKSISPAQQEDFLEKLSQNTTNNDKSNGFDFEKYVEEHPRIKNFYDYKTIEVSKKTNKDENIKHPTRIDSTITDINNKAYIPGSSIKGAIRTAIIYEYLDRENNLKSQQDYEIIVNNNEIEKIMINMSISDSSEYKNPIRTVQILPFTLTQENDNSKTKDENKEDMYNAIECICTSKLNIQIQLTEENPVNMDYIKRCLFLFNYDYIDHELTFFKKMLKKEKDINKQKQIERIIEFYNRLKQENTKETPLIRLGGSTGLLSTCIGLHMKNNNPDLYKKTYIKDKEKINEEYPKVRQITPNNQAFGWCKLKSTQTEENI